MVRGQSFTTRDLDKLPEDINLQKLFTPMNGDITAFFTQHSALSNHYPCDFTVNGNRYTSMEQYLFIRLAEIFDDRQLVQKLSIENSPTEIKKMGRKIVNFDKSIWRREIESILHQGLTEKFKQNPRLAEVLLATGDTIIVEANRHDKVYGVGLGLNDPSIGRRDRWNGENLMGKRLMVVRNSLKNIK